MDILDHNWGIVITRAGSLAWGYKKLAISNGNDIFDDNDLQLGDALYLLFKSLATNDSVMLRSWTQILCYSA